jgi:hypothetical protein
MNRLTSQATFNTFHEKVSLIKEHQTHTHTQMGKSNLVHIIICLLFITVVNTSIKFNFSNGDLYITE